MYRTLKYKKNLWIRLVPILLLFPLIGCNNLQGNNKNDDENALTFLLADSYLSAKNEEVSFAEDALGRGYNIIGNYADPKEVRGIVLDWTRLNDAGLIDDQRIETSTFKTFSGSSVSDYTESLSVSVNVSGSYKAFSGSLETNFSSESYSHSEYSYATVQSRIYKTRWSITRTSADDLKEYMTDAFREDINDESMDPIDILNLYGSHVLLGVYVGGRLDYNMSFDMSSISTNKSAGVLASASFQAVVASADVTTETLSEEETSSVSENSERTLYVYGGRSEFGQNIINDDNYEAWINSVEERPQFMDFPDTSPFIPVWELADDETRAVAIQEAFETLAGDSASNYEEQPLKVEVFLDSIQVVTANDGGGGAEEIYGYLSAAAYRSTDNLVEEYGFWETNSDNYISLSGGESISIDDRHVFTITSFDDENSFLRLYGHLYEEDDFLNGGDDDLGYHNLDVYLRDGFAGTKSIESFYYDGTRVSAHYRLAIIRE